MGYGDACLTTRSVVSAVLAAVAGRADSNAADTTAAEFAQSLQHKHNAVHDFSADFVHTYQGGVLHKQITERGHLLVKKPGKMRWSTRRRRRSSSSPDGVRIYSYVPDDKQVVVGAVPRDDQAGAPILFLAGKGNPSRGLHPVFGRCSPGRHAGEPARSSWCPSLHRPDYDSLLLVVDQQSLALRGLVTMDAQGGQSAISFMNLKENVAPADKEFAFNIPRGVDVITTP